MPYFSILLIVVTMMAMPAHALAALRSQPPLQSSGYCEKPVDRGDNVVVGLRPLRVIVMKVDQEKSTIDFISELRTPLHVTLASAEDLRLFRVGDAVELCIVEELYGEEEL